MAHAIEEVLKRPLITEKTSVQATELKKFSFEIPVWATKNHIREAFAKFFPDHKVTKVNIGKLFGKSRRTRKGTKAPVDSKKAIVTVEGEHIDYFPQV